MESRSIDCSEQQSIKHLKIIPDILNVCVVTFKVISYHGHVDVGGLELQVDLLVDESLAVIVVVHADERHLGEVLAVELLQERRLKIFFHVRVMSAMFRT